MEIKNNTCGVEALQCHGEIAEDLSLRSSRSDLPIEWAVLLGGGSVATPLFLTGKAPRCIISVSDQIINISFYNEDYAQISGTITAASGMKNAEISITNGARDNMVSVVIRSSDNE